MRQKQSTGPFIMKSNLEKYRYLLTHLQCIQIFEALFSVSHSTGPQNLQKTAFSHWSRAGLHQDQPVVCSLVCLPPWRICPIQRKMVFDCTLVIPSKVKLFSRPGKRNEWCSQNLSKESNQYLSCLVIVSISLQNYIESETAQVLNAKCFD